MNPVPPTMRTRMRRLGLSSLGPRRRVPERRLGALAPLVERGGTAIDVVLGHLARREHVGARADQDAGHVVDEAAPVRITDAAPEEELVVAPRLGARLVQKLDQATPDVRV